MEKKINNLIQISENKKYEIALSTVSECDKKYLEILNNPTVRDSTDREIKIAIDVAVSKAVVYAGRTMNDEDMKFTVNELHQVLKSKFLSLRLVELNECFRRGVAGDFGEYFGINGASLEKFINKYVEDEARKNAVKSFIQIQERINEPKEPTEEEKEKIIKDNIVNAFDLFLKKGWYDDFKNVVFFELHKRDILKLNDEIIVKSYFKAVESILKSLRCDLLKEQNKSNRDKIKYKINKIRSYNVADCKEDLEIKSISAKIMVNDFFEKIKNCNSHIRYLLEF